MTAEERAELEERAEATYEEIAEETDPLVTHRPATAMYPETPVQVTPEPRPAPAPVTFSSAIPDAATERFAQNYPNGQRVTVRPNNRIARLLQPAFICRPIPEEDLIVLEKLYWKMYPDCGRKRGALLRYIKELRALHEPPLLGKKFFLRLKNKISKLGYSV